jgi:hypothetical protein
MALESINDLQEIVAANVDAIAPGLRLLGTRVALGSASIDLLTVDPAGELTLVALGFIGDDQMVLRALEAYSWCLEYPDALGRLYPAERLSSAPPRVIFIAEKLSDAFLRKIRHLRFSRVDCLEFFFGLQFKLVEELRGTHDPNEGRAAPQPPEPPRAVVTAPPPPPRVESPPPRRPEPPPPPRAEPPVAPRPEPPRETRRREEPPAPKPVVHKPAPPPEPVVPAPVVAGDHSRPLGGSRDTRRPGDVDEDMVRVVREYLKSEFPTVVVYDFFVHDRGAQMFQLQDSQGALIHSAAVSGDVLEAGSESSLRAFLDKHRLARVLRESGAAGVLVTKSGLRVEKR